MNNSIACLFSKLTIVTGTCSIVVFRNWLC